MMCRTPSEEYSLSSIDTNPSFDTQMWDVCRFDFSFSIRLAFGKEMGRPEYSLNTVVTIKKISNIKIISGMEAVGISESSLVFL